MRMTILLSLLPLGVSHAIGLANGVKIGEVSHDSAVIWSRLTEVPEALARNESWSPEAPNWVVPGQMGELRISWRSNEDADSQSTAWLATDASDDYCRQVKLAGLKPETTYLYTVDGRTDNEMVTLSGEFTTAPRADAAQPIRFTVSTCQEFETRDDPDDGHRIYRSMAKLDPAFFVQTGDTVYYDRKQPLSKTMELARYRWHRMYALPSLKAFHRKVPSYWMHDDHDLLKDDAFPGQSYGDLTWDQGVKIWREQIPQSDLPYRTFRWGKHLQIWLPEGREFRSSNRDKDGPEKTILGDKQWEWLQRSLKGSDATFKAYISATPVVGPDRVKKNDNHANMGFNHEGTRLRELLSSVPGCFVINGDRHWQYHSVDPGTGLNEFACGASTDKHAGGWKATDKRPEHRFLRVKGGFADISVDAGAVTFIHRNVDGEEVHRTTIPAAK